LRKIGDRPQRNPLEPGRAPNWSEQEANDRKGESDQHDRVEKNANLKEETAPRGRFWFHGSCDGRGTFAHGRPFVSMICLMTHALLQATRPNRQPLWNRVRLCRGNRAIRDGQGRGVPQLSTS